MITLKRTNSEDRDFRLLVTLLDEQLRVLDSEEHSFYSQFNKIDLIRHVVIAYINDVPVGCGAIKFYGDGAAEVKRMYVRNDYRRRGVARMMLNELEYWAEELNFNACILETGKKHPEAIALYQKKGYKAIPNYGRYANVENSVCMKKHL